MAREVNIGREKDILRCSPCLRRNCVSSPLESSVLGAESSPALTLSSAGVGLEPGATEAMRDQLGIHSVS
jgi:hypothetical protein